MDALKAQDFRRVVRDRMATQRDGFVQLFRLIDATTVPEGAQRVFIGLYAQEYVGSFPAVIAYVSEDQNPVWADDPQLDRIQQRLASFKGVLDRDSFDQLTDFVMSDFGTRRPLPEQAYHQVDVVGEFILPMLRDAIKGARMSQLSIPIHVANVDSNDEVEVLYTPKGPEQPGFFKRLFGKSE